MDYNIENKGIVCFFQDLMKKRTFFLALSFVAIAFAWIFQVAIIPLGVVAVALLAICIKPTNFILRLVGFLVALGALFISLHKMNLAQSGGFYPGLIFAFVLLYLLLSWFVYNARSSEINDL
ncbi:50S ribosomal protein L20 [Campylobacter sp. RM9344]|uniref:50S ribosomal protein L20 n=1 Tax=Campylobacter californiensis TaxID=1032243 RepID=A0AAW3ZUG2_9BACT|nr:MULTISPECIES: hypothetical protein [unclassified Campylobacter]MBE2984642.1 50S ribosomal protein L20 [Campylobacter sp. RM6883]MBE2986833.1 50S ribosomal protein L20 [Campylobacter sp. RM12919]MBE2988489.1 50S ribosomal protein L20 [Campylobacter sp. RM12920]MBE2995070.1 50S ribosomal protein L20 [Campylobacter sp. RM6913]MBE3021611.1 50S ribosomal protein L20 [Campylobacter sp. 7477a]MBE3028991.1 50S ribosomal protein L20 [Campylobacter sp. RM9344]